jgi:hypothetical protein
VDRRISTRCIATMISTCKKITSIGIDVPYSLRWTGHVARMPLTRVPQKSLICWIGSPRPRGCSQMNWGRILKNALQSYDLSTEFVKWREIAADRNQWRAVGSSKIRAQRKRHRPPHDKTFGLSSDMALYPHKNKSFLGNSR